MFAQLIIKNVMNIIMIPKESHFTRMGVMSYTWCPSLKIMKPKREITKINDWLLQMRSPANECPVWLVLTATYSTREILF